MLNMIQSSNNGDFSLLKNNFHEQTVPEHLLKSFGLSMHNSSMSDSPKTIDNSLLSNFTHQENQLANQSPGSSITNRNKDIQQIQESANFGFDPFNDYTGMDQMMNQSGGNLTAKSISADNSLAFWSKDDITSPQNSIRNNRNIESFNLNRSSLYDNSGEDGQKIHNMQSLHNKDSNFFQNNNSDISDFDQLNLTANIKKTQKQIQYSPTFNSLKGNLTNSDKIQTKYSPRVNSIGSLNGCISLSNYINSEREDNELTNLNDYSNEHEDDVFAGNVNHNSSLLNDKRCNNNNNIDSFTLELYKKLLNDNRNQFNNVNGKNDSFDNTCSNMNFFNNLNSLQSGSPFSDTKSRHHSLMAPNKLQSNSFLQYFKNDNQAAPQLNTNLQGLSDQNAKKRASSFGFNNLIQANNSGQFMNTDALQLQINSRYRTGSINSGNSLMSNLQQANPFTNSFNTNSNNNNNQLHFNNSSINEYLLSNNNSSIHSICSTNSQLANANNNKPLRSQRLPSQFIEEIVRQAKLRRRGGGKKEVCVFCRNNGEKEQIYTSHTLKDSANRVSCPILRLYQCPICHATADNAHTIKYCPYAEKDNGSIKLFKDSRMNTAVLLMNSSILANNTPPSSPSPPMLLQSSSSSVNNKQQSQLSISTMNANQTPLTQSLVDAISFNTMSVNKASNILNNSVRMH